MRAPANLEGPPGGRWERSRNLLWSAEGLVGTHCGDLESCGKLPLGCWVLLGAAWDHLCSVLMCCISALRARRSARGDV